MWTVSIKSSGGIKNGWDYPSDYFPRRTYYKADAIKIKQQAERKGATGVTVERTKK